MPDLFSSVGNRGFESIEMPDADVQFKADFLGQQEASVAFHELRESIAWQKRKVFVWGKWHDQPRLIAWHGDEGTTYSYSGAVLDPQPWSPALLSLKERIEQAVGASFNSVLLNLYRDHNDSMGWHSDNEASLGERPVIASLSLGGTREFLFKHRTDKLQKIRKLPLHSGSLLLMQGQTQANWLHAINRQKADSGPRINLTFRQIT